MRILILVMTVALSAAACGGSVDPGSPGSPGGDGRDGDVGDGRDGDPVADAPIGSWQLVDTDPPIEVPEGSRVTLSVEEDSEENGGQLRVGGTAACNHYGGTLRVDGDAWEVTELFQTEMACEPPAAMEAERAYLEALGTVDTWSRSDDTLRLAGGDVALTFELLPEVPTASLTGTTWEVDGFVQGTGDDGAVSSGVAGVEPATVRLDDDGTIELFTGCRDFVGQWTTAGDEVVLTSFGQAEGSRGVDADGQLTCDEQSEAQERDVLAVVESGMVAEIDGRRLTLRNGEVGLVLRATG